MTSSKISGKYTNFTVFFLPSIVLLGGLVVLPIFLDIAVAFTDMAQTLNVSGLTNMQFRKFFKPVEDSMLGFELRRSFLKALTLTATYVVLTLVIFNTTFGLVLALTTTALSERVGSFFRAIWLLPRMSPSVVYALLWSWTIDPTERGLLNQVAINIFGIGPINMKLHHPMMLIVISNGFIGASLGMIILTSAIRSIPKHLFYAARADGAGPLSITWHIILPALRWPLSYITIFQTLALLVSFEYIFLIMGPARSTMTMAMLAYTKTLAPGVGAGLYAYGAAITMILIVIGVLLALLLWRLSNMQRLITEPRIEVQ